MAENYASGNWMVRAGQEDEFVQRWEAFLAWTRDAVPGFDHAKLIRHTDHPQHFVSFAHWKDADSLTAWKQQPEFAEHFGACQSLCDEFHGGDYEQVASF